MTSNTATSAPQILVVDDEPDLRTLYELTLLRAGYRVEAAGSLEQARQLLSAHHFDVVITDMRLPDGLGLELIQQIRAQHGPERCIVITAFGSAENAVESLKAGAFDYLTKPVDLKQFRNVIASAMLDPLPQAGIAANAGSAVARGSGAGATALQQLVGESSSMREVKELIVKVAHSMAPVLIRGESGTGKELAARAIHANSHRWRGPLVAVNCSAIPENLLETEFFGAKKGAYTGSARDRDGFFQAANGGTLLLDEIGDLPLAMQSKLLRAIQERCIRPIGSPQEEAVDVRIISATHKDLAVEVQAGRFRQDLYYRLNVIEIVLPPLRERRDDLPALCRFLLRRIAHESGIPVPALSATLLDQLALQPLPGNVRELENLLHRALTLSEADNLLIEPLGAWAAERSAQVKEEPAPRAGDTEQNALPPGLLVRQTPVATPLEHDESSLPSDLQSHLDHQEREILIQALRASGFNRTAAAARLGLSLRQIRYRIARLHIDTPHSGEASDEAL